MSRLSMDLKVMSRSQKGHQFILCIIDEVTNYLVAAPLYQAKSKEVGEALIKNVITKFWYARLYEYGSGQCIHVILNELLIQEIKNHHQNCRSLQPQITTSRAQHKIIVQHIVQTLDRSGTDVAQNSYP